MSTDITRIRPWLIATLVFAMVAPVSASTGESLFVNGFDGGLACTTAADGPVEIDIHSVRVDPVFLLDGRPFSSSPLSSATFFLIPDEGEPIALGTSFDAPAPVRVITGVYDVEYRWRSGTTVPRNVAARVRQGVFLDSDTTLVVDVPSQQVEGALTLDGAPYQQAGSTVFLEGVHGLGRVVLGATPQPNYSVRLIPGAYRFGYESVTTALSLPANRRALRGRHDIDAGVQVVDLDLPSLSTTWQFRFDNVPAPNLGSENGAVSLRTLDGDRVDLGQTRQQVVGWRIVPGIYEVYYEGLTGAEIAPANGEMRISANRPVLVGQQILNIQTALIEGPLLINGTLAPAIATERGRVWLRDRVTGDDTLLGTTDDQQYARRIVRGTYDLAYQRVTGSVLVPRNDFAVFAYGREFFASGNFPLDIPMADGQLALTLNGAPFPNLAIENARLYLRSPADDADLFGPTTQSIGAGSSSWLLLPGPYAPLLARITGSELVPANSRARLATDFVVQPGAPATQTVDVHTGEFEFDFRNNGAAFASNDIHVAAFDLRHFDDVVSLGRTNFDVGPRILVRNVDPLADGRSGTLYYTWQAGTGTAIPRNIGTPAACVIFDPD